MKKLPTVTVAISALNEEENIVRFLSSVLLQSEEGFIIQKILVISDGSTDQTVQKVKGMHSPKIEVREYFERIGKSSRLNEIYSGLTSDILVQSDADVIYNHKNVIRDLIAPIINDKKVYMCGGHPMPTPGKTFTENSINFTFNVYSKLRSEVRHGNNVLSADGRLLAYKKELVKKITVPDTMIANDAFTYYSCLSLGYKYVYVSTAIVLFRSPITLKDQIRQNTRFIAAPIRLNKYFSKELIKQETYIPLHLLFKYTLLEFLTNPVGCCYIFLVNRYCYLLALLNENKLTAKWDMAFSTKSFK